MWSQQNPHLQLSSMQAGRLPNHTFHSPFPDPYSKWQKGQGVSAEKQLPFFHNPHNTAIPHKLKRKKYIAGKGRRRKALRIIYERLKLQVPLKEKKTNLESTGKKKRGKQGLDLDKNEKTKLSKIETKRVEGKKGAGDAEVAVEPAHPSTRRVGGGRADAGWRSVVADCNCNPTS